jgi:transmembrane 9 superfamily member 2/4
MVSASAIGHCLLGLLLLLTRPADAYYLPGIAPVDYIQGAPIDILATRLTSTGEKLPYSYYSLPFCKPDDTAKPKSQPVNLGQILVGERAYPTAFDIHMAVPQTVTFPCAVDLSRVSKGQFKALTSRIKQGYSVRLSADNLPLVFRRDGKDGHKVPQIGYPLGFVEGDDVFINNHIDFTFHINTPSMTPESAGKVFAVYTEDQATLDTYRIVGFEAKARSIGRGSQTSNTSWLETTTRQRVAVHEEVKFGYSVEFRLSAQDWATRWDPLIERGVDVKNIRWYSITNAILVLTILGGLLAAIIVHSLAKDIVRYDEIEDPNAEDTTGWKILLGDVFRTPNYPVLFSVCVGCGTQILAIALATQTLALFGFLSPAKRGSLASILVSSYVLSSIVAGYFSARVYSQFESPSSQRYVAVGSVFLFPGMCFGIFFALNLAVFFAGSSSAVPFSTLALLLFLWFGISAPLVLLGSYLGCRKTSKQNTFHTNHIARTVPPKAQAMVPLLHVAVGLVSFSAIFVELVLILDDFNKGHIFFLYGAMLTLFFILLVTSAESSILVTYLGLCRGNWKWMWQSFASAASCGVYVFAYAVYYLFRTPDGAPEGAAFVAWLVYLSYMGIASGAFALMCGCIGFHASNWFVHVIYRRVRENL